MNTRRLKPSPLPEPEAPAQYAWREGWWQGIGVGFVIGFAVALIFFRG